MNGQNVTGHQSIHCDVKSCVYNDMSDCCCTLSSIHVQPNANASTGKATDESNCGSYVARH